MLNTHYGAIKNGQKHYYIWKPQITAQIGGEGENQFKPRKSSFYIFKKIGFLLKLLFSLINANVS